MKMREFAEQSKAWPFEEARKVLARIEKSGAQEAIFETGYGASGLPHMGTFGEVVRTSMVRHAFSILAPILPPALSVFPMIWTACAKFPKMCPMQTCWPSIWKNR